MQNTPMHVFIRSLALVLAFVGPLHLAQPSSTAAQGVREDRHRVPADYMSFRGADWLERGERIQEEQPERVLEAMGLQPGDVVADVGCGSGYYARQIAPRVQPGGKVYCEDIQPEMLEIMQDLAAAEGVTGIESILGTFVDPMLPAGELDWVIIADVYHEMSDPEPMLAGIRRALAPGGQVALLEYRVEDGTGDSIKADHTMSVRQVLLEWTAAGFELAALHDFLPGQHLFFFRSADGAHGTPAVTEHDLLDALDAGVVEAEAIGDDTDTVKIRIRRTGAEPIVVTSPVATYFRTDGGIRDMIARRDGWIVLADDGWHDWSVRTVGRQPDLPTPDGGDRLEILPPSTASRLEELLYQIQVGTYTVADSPTLYPPLTRGVEQAAVWIADADLSYDAMSDDVKDERLPSQYAVAFALVMVDQAGMDVTTRHVWDDREQVFGALRDQGLRLWYQIKTTGLSR